MGLHSLFSDCDKLQTIYVPAGSEQAYKTAPIWKDYAHKIQGQ
ncbi:hypothetical protein QIU19_07075 [Capnocytophaga canimorsus]|nr:hypothetical protein [Capnocytophaga canimorsus]WGU69416.1 hypothetical protein QIU19_07075 [Capnocytophaga canimorsus]